MCKDDRTIIDNKNDQANGPEQMNTAFDPMKLKRSFILFLILSKLLDVLMFYFKLD